MRRNILGLFAGVILAGCQMTPDMGARIAPVAVMPPRTATPAEEAIGQRENPRVVAEYGGIYSDEKVELAIARVVSRLVDASDDPSRVYKVTILNSPVANAFALPGGYLYVTRGLIALTDDSSELAAVLSHEIAHVILKHAMARAQVVEQADLVERVASDVLSDPAAGEQARTSSRLSLAKFSRDQEVEADKTGIAISGKAGFDPFAASRFLDKLEQYSAFRSALGKKDDAQSFLATHPAALERRDLAVVAARQFGAPGIGERGQDTFLESLDGMIYGDDPAEGFVRGQEFLHPRLAIGFRVPDNYRLENTKDAVLAAAGDDTAMRFDGVSAGANVAPTEYLASGWINGLTEGSIREIDVNGQPGATAEATAGDWVFRIGAIRIGGSMYRLIFADRHDGDAIERALNETLGTFHRLQPTEVARLKPLRLSIVDVRDGDTVASLAARMEGTERRLELFRLLNGLKPGDPVAPGRKVKLVTD